MAGLIQGYRVVVFGMAFALFSACVDQDDVLRALRRFSYRSALTAVLATRLVPVLARDASRMSDASRCRPVPAGRLELARAALAGSLERAVDVAAALEVRGYSRAGRPARRRRRRSRHDVRVLAAAGAIAGGAVALRIAGAGWVQEYPTLAMPLGPLELAVCAVVLAGAALPFAGRGARLGVAARA
jgi:energy-coupling factor transport system permease protein